MPAAAPLKGAAASGESSHVLQSAESMSRRSNVDAPNAGRLYAALKQFFTDNPGWE